MRNIRLILTVNDLLPTITPTDYENIDFSGTCLQETHDSSFYVSHDRLGLVKKNTVGLIASTDFQRKCMLLLSTVDFLFIDFGVTLKTQDYDTYYKEILFDTAWLLVVCDTISLVENMYEDSSYGQSLINVCPGDWKGKSILEQENLRRDSTYEDELKSLRNKFAAHIDTSESLESLNELFRSFDLQKLYSYCNYHMQVFQKACSTDVRTSMFCSRDQKLSGGIIGLSYSEHKDINK